MKFDLAYHNRLYNEWHATHTSTCLCKRFKDGEDMWKPNDPLKQVPDDKLPDRDPQVRKLLGKAQRQDEEEEASGKKFDKLFEL